ncbi:MAG TPA: sugar ABC transporter permease [Acidimicrobiales bacterium]|nr:sugar ABC transporter permease [Acidimicrobiales bacterium]
MLIEAPVAPIVRHEVALVRRPWWRRVSLRATPYLYVLPALAVVALWIYRPLIQTVQYSFYRWNLLPTQPQVAVGWTNYHEALTLPQLWGAVRTTGIYLGGMLVMGVLIPLFIGVLTQQVGPRARSIYRALIFVPVLVSPIVAAAVWSFLLAPDGGLVNRMLGWVGLSPVSWLTTPDAARGAIVIISGWKILGISVLIVTAGLAAISPEYHEAATVDGASRWQLFRRITLPLLSPTLLFMVITSVLLSSQIIFPLLTSLTQGGPSNATTDIYYLLYTFGFSSFNVGLASATAVLFFIVFGIIAVILVQLLERFSIYDS